ncbi:MAG: hypothetical protein CMA30_02670 [Euryarchaeota archaeon]|nr:hypothetical protein [Euryarchaeota archaeon]|tara:strand:+ start:309 stop:506 length:198 start_codon:yes stop_codon:yes gene_type:complete
MMNEKQMISKHIDVVIAIRELAEAHLRNNPEMSSGAVVELLMEGIEEDVFDGWEPGEELERLPLD